MNNLTLGKDGLLVGTPEERGTCERCGASIKHIYQFKGNTYGSTCIEYASGIKPDQWVMVNGVGDETETIKRQEAIQAQVAKFRAQKKAEEKAINNNRAKYEDLLDMLDKSIRDNGDFCDNMWHKLGYSTESGLNNIFSPRQLEIIREIWGKQAGRKNSKAYKAALSIFDTQFG